MIKLFALGLWLVSAALSSASAFLVSSFGVDLASYSINIATFWSGIAILILATVVYLLNRSYSAAEK